MSPANIDSRTARRYALRWIVLGALCAIVFVLGWIAGRSGSEDEQESSRVVQRALSEMQAELEDERNARVLAEVDSKISRDALDQLRRELVEWRELSDEQERELGLYRSLIEPDAVTSVFSIEGLRLIRRENPGEYLFELTLLQRGRNQASLSGELVLELQGSDSSGNRVVLSHQALGISLAESQFEFQFFQRIRGDLIIPPEMSPEILVMRAMVEGQDSPWYESQLVWKELVSPQILD